MLIIRLLSFLLIIISLFIIISIFIHHLNHQLYCYFLYSLILVVIIRNSYLCIIRHSLVCILLYYFLFLLQKYLLIIHLIYLLIYYISYFLYWNKIMMVINLIELIIWIKIMNGKLHQSILHYLILFLLKFELRSLYFQLKFFFRDYYLIKVNNKIIQDNIFKNVLFFLLQILL